MSTSDEGKTHSPTRTKFQETKSGCWQFLSTTVMISAQFSYLDVSTSLHRPFSQDSSMLVVGGAWSVVGPRASRR